MNEETIYSLDEKNSGLIPIEGNIPWDFYEARMSIYESADWGDAEECDVYLAGLFTPQRFLDRSRLLWHFYNPIDKPAHLAETPHGLLIIDGHHRLAISFLSGKYVVKMKLKKFSL